MLCMLCQQNLKYALKITRAWQGRFSFFVFSRGGLLLRACDNVRVPLGVRSGPAHYNRLSYKYTPVDGK